MICGAMLKYMKGRLNNKIDLKLNKERFKTSFEEIYKIISTDKEATDCCGVSYAYKVGIYNGEPYFEKWDFCPDCLE